MSLADTPSLILATHLISLATEVTDPSLGGTWPLYTGFMPDNKNVKDDAVAIFDTAGVKDGRLMTGLTIHKYGMQIRVRSRKQTDGWAKIAAIATELEAIDRTNATPTVNGTKYEFLNVSPTSAPLFIGVEEGTERRYLFVLNILVSLRVFVVVTVPPFTLLTEPGLRLWFDSVAITGKSDEDLITTLVDASGEGTDVTQTTPSNQASYQTNEFGTKPGIRVDGVDDIMLATIANWRAADNKGTVYIVFKPSSVSGYRVLLASSDTGGAENGIEFALSGNKIRITYRDGATTNAVDGTTPLSVGVQYLLTWTTTGSAYVMKINGVEEALTVVAGVNDGKWFDTLPTLRDVVGVGALQRTSQSSYAAGDFGEIGYYDTEKDTAADTAITDHLKTKWGVPASSLLVGWDELMFYRMEEASGVRFDSGGNSRDFSDNNTVTQADGKIGKAGQFTRANAEYLTLAHDVAFNTDGKWYYISCWVYFDSISTIVNEIFSKAWALRHNRQGANDQFELGVVKATTFGAASINTWHHILYEQNPVTGDAHMRINGGTKDTGTQNLLDNTTQVEIGRKNGSDQYMDGRIDAVGVFVGREMTEAEQQQLAVGDAKSEYPF